MNDDTTPNEAMVSLPAHDLCDSTTVVAPGPLLPPVAVVLQRQSADVAFMSPEVLREKLRRAGYREPILPVPSPCSVDGCPNITCDTVCFDCATEIEFMARAEEDRKSRKKAAAAFWPALILVTSLLAGLFYAASELGAWIRMVWP